MSTYTFLSSYNYGNTIELIRDEIRALLERGTISRHQRIYSLANYIPPREWLSIEKQLEEKDYLLRDRIGDLLGVENWDND
ncbi:MAG: DUF4327 family protein [Cyanobacteria bacterium]|nr:DUF4327 family protein [Cyanobacteria bacterium CG_2015-16_32_12]NCO78712.1 DUF4327 family protein [Cyanobacteria bacterium CG_2015-22_32_23]NCQ05734.1 DUF4327 family protein [Cyanobacteria bacterium CG_2015-09_32_10]NCQ41121.1 DUF4327 family protein [Cyanobacteria bacterium CG_2015-04_32_10]NCS85352.1 DUF4327 family protein [Cyanobacteria bacterium CG_2015-02_32_10]